MGRRVARLILFVLVGLVAARKLRAAKGAKRKAKHKKVQFADDDDDDVGDEESNLRGGPSDDDDDDDVEEEAGGDGADEEDDDEANDDDDAYGDDDDDAYGDDDDAADGWSEGEAAEASKAEPPRGTRPSEEELRERRREWKLEQEAMRLKHEKSRRHKKHHRKSHSDGFATMESRAGAVEDWDGRRWRTTAADLRTEEGLFKGGDEAAALEQVRFERELERMREDPDRWRGANADAGATTKGAKARVDHTLSFGAPFARSASADRARLLQSELRMADGAAPAGFEHPGQWRTFGEATVKKHFARLAGPGAGLREEDDALYEPAGWSRGAGALWSLKRTGAREVAATLDFRVAGPRSWNKEDTHASGLVLWVTDNAVFRPGDLRGTTFDFAGVGVAAGAKSRATLSDVQVFVGLRDGKPPSEAAFLQRGVGCDAKIRYDTTRQDVTVANHTKLRVIFKEADGDEGGLSLHVFVDEGRGFRSCAKDIALPRALNADWLQGAYLGVTSVKNERSPGDTIDVRRLQVVASHATGRGKVAGLSIDDALAELARAGVDFDHPEDLRRLPLRDRFDRAEQVVGRLLEAVDDVMHHVEYQLLDRESALDSVLNSIENAANAQVARLKVLETELAAGAEASLDGRLKKLEADTAAVHQRPQSSGGTLFTAAHEKVFEGTIERFQARLIKRKIGSYVRTIGGSFAFLVIVVLHIAALYSAIFFHDTLKRDKML